MSKKGEGKGGGKKESLCRVSALCPARTMTFDLTNGVCNRQRMCNTRVIAADVKSTQVLCNYGLWMVCGSNTPRDERGQLPTSTCQHDALWQVQEVSYEHFQKQFIQLVLTLRNPYLLEVKHLPVEVEPGSSPRHGSQH